METIFTALAGKRDLQQRNNTSIQIIVTSTGKYVGRFGFPTLIQGRSPEYLQLYATFLYEVIKTVISLESPLSFLCFSVNLQKQDTTLETNWTQLDDNIEMDVSE